MKGIEGIIKFTELLHQYRTIERRILTKDNDRRENDVEHSYSLAMLAWYICTTYKLDLDIEKVFKYALAHDLVEVYAGDTFFFETDTSIVESKNERESDAAIILKNEYSEFHDLHDAILGYKEKSDCESKFVYALDKIEPMLSIYIDKGRTWKRDNITLDMLIDKKTDKVSLNKTTEKIFHELIEKIKQDHDKLFFDDESNT